MTFTSDASLRPEPSTKRWQPDGPEGQQLKNDILSSFQDGSLDADNPDYMILYRKSPLLYGKYSKQVFRNHAKAAIADLVSAQGHNAGSKGELAKKRHC